ncbi:hypothetical protein ACHAWF_015932, partial [Thalassiosira exigua]
DIILHAHHPSHPRCFLSHYSLCSSPLVRPIRSGRRSKRTPARTTTRRRRTPTASRRRSARSTCPRGGWTRSSSGTRNFARSGTIPSVRRMI